MPAQKKSDTARNRIMDEAPLFAGLDGFVVQQLEKQVDAQPKKEKSIRENKQPVKKVAKKSTKDVPPPHAASKQKVSRKSAPKPEKIDHDALLLSIREMCLLLKISRATLVRMDNAGKIPGRMKLGGSVRFHRATVVAWLEGMISQPVPF